MRLFIIFSLLFAPLFSNTDPSPQPTDETTTTNDPWQHLCATHGVKQWYMEAIDYTDVLQSERHLTTLPMLELAEYQVGGEQYNRKTSPFLHDIETTILTSIKEATVDLPQGAPIRLLSIQCAGHLEDWYIIGRLIQSGKTNIELTIVNTEEVQCCIDGLIQLRDALEKEGISLKISTYQSFKDCATNEKQPFHAAYAVNYYYLAGCCQHTWETIDLARKMLTPSAKLTACYLQEVFQINPQGNLTVLSSSPKNTQIRQAIVDAQLNNPRFKDQSIKIQIAFCERNFFVGPLLYAMIDLAEKGYKDLVVFSGMLEGKYFCEREFSSFLSRITNGHATISFKKSQYVYSNHEDRRDLVIISAPDAESKDLIKYLNRNVVVFQRVMAANGHWIIRGKEIGLWDVDGLGKAKAVAVSAESRQKGMKTLDSLFANGIKWG